MPLPSRDLSTSSWNPAFLPGHRQSMNPAAWPSSELVNDRECIYIWDVSTLLRRLICRQKRGLLSFTAFRTNRIILTIPLKFDWEFPYKVLTSKTTSPRNHFGAGHHLAPIRGNVFSHCFPERRRIDVIIFFASEEFARLSMSGISIAEPCLCYLDNRRQSTYSINQSDRGKDSQLWDSDRDDHKMGLVWASFETALIKQVPG